MIKSTSFSLNSHVENLKLQLSQSELSSLECVIIAHSDNQMIHQLKEAFVKNEIAVLALPQHDWVMNDDAVNELMDWLLNELKISNVLLVGHSHGGTPTDTVQVCGSGQLAPAADKQSENRLSSVFDRLQYAQACAQQTEKHFLEQLECLRSLPSVSSQLVRSPQLVKGLFYRAESGVFCYFDAETQQFRALVSDLA